MFTIVPSPPMPRAPMLPKADFGASGLAGLMVFCSPILREAVTPACSPSAESARTGAGDGAGFGGFFAEPPIMRLESYMICL